MKRILIITLEFPPQIGGIAAYAHDLASALPAAKVVVLAPRLKKGDDADIQAPYEIVRQKLFFPRWVWPRWLRLLLVSAWIVRRKKIELVLIHHILPAGYAGWLIKKIFRVPYLLFSHGTDVLAAAGTRRKKAFTGLIARGAEQLVFNSESLRRRFLRVWPELEKNSLVLYPCPHPDFFAPPPPAELHELRRRLALEGKRVVLSVARLAEGKGFPHLIRIMDKVLARNPNVVWLIVGTGPKEAEILAQIQKKSLQNIVRFIGEVPRSRLPAYYYLADLFVLLTHPDEGREEGLGLVFLEAGAAGLPVIAGKSGGVEEGVAQAETGLVFDVYRESRHIEDAIVELLENRAYARQLGAQARERLNSEFSWPHQLDKLAPWIG
ncbi:MAG: Glycosyl transferase group 1 [Candidatus Magasanikbacteria bacterium GW2011_GWA2_56_11]|uniref:Glycosyl transferase group 1 n=1 Tax=Candidatus Magasanikbacteria bacterium GW2011_GWA2_56_11 TaxID=1619044 RepID=A0A0G2AK81_9BACT|nr:MAG: Glycosyl transferase group 1 [Candidatus Magasanikbacteria bacterium GW2011_GWA2_56_11]